ncbi:MAG: VapC toxin family PIN domain ribonuclease [Vicinamibacterales bacterium]|nr:VapC toxin family PIN domain ribonuclease [Vicinamibacterales bacterium]
MSRPALLDVNLLVALFDPDHVHHELGHDWFADHRADGWATCPFTETAFVRVLCNPAYGAAVRQPVELIQRLEQFCASKQHVFWSDGLSLRDAKIFNPAFIAGHRQVSDIYLLGLARKMGGRLATFDRGIQLGAVAGATRSHLAIISATAE